MHIGIVSINKYSKHLNYGAALHSYAFQRFLDNNSIPNTIIDFLPRFMEKYSLKWPMFSRQPRDQIRRSAAWTIGAIDNRIKYEKFQHFFDLNYRTTHSVFTGKQFGQAELPFTTIACANDVIWSPHTTQGFEEAFFAAAPAMRRLNSFSYAASIGYTNFTSAQEIQFRRLLTHVDTIGIREYPALDFVKQFTDKPVTVTLDSTLLLTEKDYLRIAKPPKSTGYVLVYNCLKNNRSMIRDAEKYAKEQGLDLIEVSNYTHNKIDHRTLSNAGIDEFLGLFKNASCVYSNAFHGLCFSLVFQKPFLVYARGTKDSRVTSLLGILGIPDCFVREDEFDRQPSELDWANVGNRLGEERLKSTTFLSEAIGETVRIN